MSATTSTSIRTWADDPEDGRSEDAWPYPTEHEQFLIGGELADRIRAALGEPPESAVYITEDRVSGGYSEWTQETELFFNIDCGSHHIEFDAYWPRVEYGATTVARLSAWLAEKESA